VENAAGIWTVQWRSRHHQKWCTTSAPSTRTIKAVASAEHVQFRCTLAELAPGTRFEYRVLRDGIELFSARATAPKRRNQRHRVVLFGDLADGEPGSARVANQALSLGPDLVVLAGDLVYEKGRISDYHRKLFPAFNSSKGKGAPLMASTICAAVVGNHDIGTPRPREVSESGQLPDLLAYFQYWSHPANGPALPEQPPKLGRRKWRKMSKIVGKDFTKRTSFSFDFGDVHWLLLDGNKYMNWSDESLKQWVRNDLNKAGTRWKFVVVHQPGFNNDASYSGHQHMRLLAPVFEECGVTFVFSGHCHYYHASKPIRFVAAQCSAPLESLTLCQIDGDIQADEHFDGRQHTNPQGVIYVISGAGGKLVTEPYLPKPVDWTRKQNHKVRSVTVLDVSADRVTLKQVSDSGEELDRFSVTKPKEFSSRTRQNARSAI
jgi:predicted MPP superfamily phosphohydrolase